MTIAVSSMHQRKLLMTIVGLHPIKYSELKISFKRGDKMSSWLNDIASISRVLTKPKDTIQLTGWKQGQVFNSKSGCTCAMHLCCYEAKRPNLKLKTRPKRLLGYLPLAFELPAEPGQSFRRFWGKFFGRSRHWPFERGREGRTRSGVKVVRLFFPLHHWRCGKLS